MLYTNETLSVSALHLAAKVDVQEKTWLPLWVHSMDTCIIAEHLLTEWLPDSTCRLLSENLGTDELLYAVRAAAVLHDIGKASISFQSRITHNLVALRTGLNENGLPLLSDDRILHTKSLHHTAMGEILLLRAGCHLSFAEVIGAHHGRPWAEGEELYDELQAGEWADPRSKYLWGNKEQKAQWQTVQMECIHWMMHTVNCGSADKLPEISQATAMLLTGLVIMADWIASNEDYFPLIDVDALAPLNMENRGDRGWKAVSLPPAWKSCPYERPEDLFFLQFGFAPNTMQQAMIHVIEESKEPGLIILEAPMGLGKTEAALMAANMNTNRGAGGIFFGLPTQATANAVFDRVVQWAESQPSENQISIRLAHGMADYHKEYRDLMAGSSTASIEADGETDTLVVHEWFRGSKQALLADFVVGTVDQVLMASLKQKHIMLRHLGLSGKTVIIDECHAYDAYMSQYLEETLRWLGYYRTPVVMLSATLPADRRGAFMAAYLNLSSRNTKKLQNETWFRSQAYPSITWTDGGNVHHTGIELHGSKKHITMHRLIHGDSMESQTEAVTAVLKKVLSEGGCAAIVLNTVRRAQYFADQLRRNFGQDPAFQKTEILLVHARFVMEDRLRHEEELLRRAGKRSGRAERDRFIVVGSQVIEQSLDFDVDVMVTDLCPMDLLMQRMGRLHRHSQHDAIRPESLRDPACYVLCTGENMDRSAEYVYGKYLLMRTSHFLPETIIMPDDISRLVKEVYDDTKPLSGELPGYAQAEDEFRRKKEELKRKATAFRIHAPDTPSFGQLLEGSIPPDEDHARAQVRDGEMGMDVLLLKRTGSGDLAPVSEEERDTFWRQDVCPSVAECYRILSQRISLPAGFIQSLLRKMTWDELQNAVAVPQVWEKSPWLKRSHMLVLDDRLEMILCGHILHYSKEDGLKWEMENMEV